MQLVSTSNETLVIRSGGLFCPLFFFLNLFVYRVYSASFLNSFDLFILAYVRKSREFSLLWPHWSTACRLPLGVFTMRQIEGVIRTVPGEETTRVWIPASVWEGGWRERARVCPCVRASLLLACQSLCACTIWLRHSCNPWSQSENARVCSCSIVMDTYFGSCEWNPSVDWGDCAYHFT